MSGLYPKAQSNCSFAARIDSSNRRKFRGAQLNGYGQNNRNRQ
jgi:hypothetical protein